jgi:hypothetical protein
MLRTSVGERDLGLGASRGAHAHHSERHRMQAGGPPGAG